MNYWKDTKQRINKSEVSYGRRIPLSFQDVRLYYYRSDGLDTTFVVLFNSRHLK